MVIAARVSSLPAILITLPIRFRQRSLAAFGMAVTNRSPADSPPACLGGSTVSAGLQSQGLLSRSSR
jgi:hypothetical protein